NPAQRGELRLIDRDDHLAELAVRHAVLLAVLTHLDPAGAAQFGLQRAGLVVEPGMHDAAVVAGLVHAGLQFLVEDLDQGTGAGLEHPACDGQPDDAGADHRDTVSTHAVRHSAAGAALFGRQGRFASTSPLPPDLVDHMTPAAGT